MNARPIDPPPSDNMLAIHGVPHKFVGASFREQVFIAEEEEEEEGKREIRPCGV